MHDDRSAQDATRLLVAFSSNHAEARMVSPEARRVSPFGMDRPFVPNWADAEQAGLDRVRRDDAMRWLVENDMLERDEEAETLLVTGEGFPDYAFGSVFRVTDPGRVLLAKIRQQRGQQARSPSVEEEPERGQHRSDASSTREGPQGPIVA